MSDIRQWKRYRECLTSVILPTTTSPTSPLNLPLHLIQHKTINLCKSSICTTTPQLNHLPGFKRSNTDQLVDSLHLSCYWSRQLVFINISAMTPGDKLSIRLLILNTTNDWVLQSTGNPVNTMLGKLWPSDSPHRRCCDFQMIKLWFWILITIYLGLEMLYQPENVGQQNTRRAYAIHLRWQPR